MGEDHAKTGNCNMESHVTRLGMGNRKRSQYHFSWHKIDNAPSFWVVTDQATLPQGPEPVVLLHQIILHQRDRQSANASHLCLTTNSACMTLFLHHAPTMGVDVGVDVGEDDVPPPRLTEGLG
jgi:hypothetical protein